jgi:hypothetical protein
VASGSRLLGQTHLLVPPELSGLQAISRFYSRHGLTAAKARIRLRGFAALDRRTVGARAMLTFRDELVSAWGRALSPQR